MTATASRPKEQLSAAEQRLAGLLAIAARSLSQGGHDDFNQGQVSARLPGSDRFLIKNALAGFDQCTPDSVVLASVNPEDTPHRYAPPELVLHQAVYLARPDVNSIVHSHAPQTLVFGATDLQLRAVSHDGAFFQGRLPRFTQTSQTILDLVVATAVASALGDAPAALLRNHGGVIVGKSIRHACVFAHVLERACMLQLVAEQARGGYHCSDDADIEAKREFNFADLSVKSYWDHCVDRVVASEPAAAGWKEIRR
jgi:L-fuculose-phosphate aldolase